MSESSPTVAPLKRVCLSIEAGPAANDMTLTDRPVPFEFIFGIGKEGLAPIERHLMDTAVGDTLLVPVGRNGLPGILEHLLPEFPVQPPSDAPFYLSVHIRDVQAPDSRDVVRAIAGTASCGGCCGHH